ncbi:Sterol O-acyltransferase 1 [Thelohanellus kitauei]|uniref:Sterol O-acyltransferase 1 n=1 Tax=Thelohanellus kitauei TaxID=669202 RepID=A0A0C2N3A2_THEKT|nr:Sterol O-acyltransferase 1 [Thelohanellus kitauei]
MIANTIPATIFMISFIFYFYLHSFLNFWAETLKFGDRMFYTDWWNSVSYGEFYKTWNIVVGDWLKTYIFYEAKNMIKPPFNNYIAATLAITISSIIHEYIMYVAVGSFCPVVSFTFGMFGLLLKFFTPDITSNTKHRIWNLLFWVSFSFGNSINITLYSLETALSSSCTIQKNSIFDYLRPKFTFSQCYGH